eukprot:3120831-Amphidinium_carterae.1
MGTTDLSPQDSPLGVPLLGLCAIHICNLNTSARKSGNVANPAQAHWQQVHQRHHTWHACAISQV